MGNWSALLAGRKRLPVAKSSTTTKFLSKFLSKKIFSVEYVHIIIIKYYVVAMKHTILSNCKIAKEEKSKDLLRVYYKELVSDTDIEKMIKKLSFNPIIKK